MPSGTEVHIGVYDFHERQHAQLQQRRNDLVALLMYLTERRLFFSINHVFSSLTGAPRARGLRVVPANTFRRLKRATATCCRAQMPMPPIWPKQWRKIGNRRKRRSCACRRSEPPTRKFRARAIRKNSSTGLRNGQGRVAGESGGFSKLTRDVLSIAYRNDARKILDGAARRRSRSRFPRSPSELLPREHLFSRRWAAQILDQPESRKRPALDRRAATGWWRNLYDGSESGLEPDSIERPSADAPRSSLARAAMVSNPDDRCNARRRWLAVVRAGPDSAVLRRRRIASRRSARALRPLFAGILLFRALKHASRRKRPCEIEPHCWASILPPDKYSFPSGHSITAFAVAMSIGLFYPQLQGCLLATAFLIAGSRIILGMHFLSDVLAGSVLGRAAGPDQLPYFLGVLNRSCSPGLLQPLLSLR